MAINKDLEQIKQLSEKPHEIRLFIPAKKNEGNYTRLQMLEDMVFMWVWLMQHPTKRKRDFSLANPERTRTTCPTCHYDDRNKGNCECPFPWNRFDYSSECDDWDSLHFNYKTFRLDHPKNLAKQRIIRTEIAKLAITELYKYKQQLDVTARQYQKHWQGFHGVVFVDQETDKG